MKMSFLKICLLFYLLLDLSNWILAYRMGKDGAPRTRSLSPVRRLHLPTCPAAGCPLLVDPIVECQIETFCNHETGHCSVLLNEHSLNAIRAQRGERPIDWNSIARSQLQSEVAASTPITEGAWSQLYPNGHPADNADVNSLLITDEDETEAEIDTAAGRQAVKCPDRGHHIECKKNSPDCTRYDRAAYCVLNKFGDGLCYVDVVNPYNHQIEHRNRFK